jgi:hypothetical protein
MKAYSYGFIRRLVGLGHVEHAVDETERLAFILDAVLDAIVLSMLQKANLLSGVWSDDHEHRIYHASWRRAWWIGP